MAISSVLGSSALLPAGLGFRNLLINGDMTVDQRNLGTSVSINYTGFAVDRWVLNVSPNGRMTFGKNSNGLNPPAGFNNYLGAKSTSSYSLAAGDFFTIYQSIEGFNSAKLSWGTSSAKPVTVSFWVNASIAGTYTGYFENGSYNRSYVFTYVVNSPNTWEYKTININGDTSGTWATGNTVGVNLGFSLGVGATYIGTPNVWTAGDINGVSGGVSVVGTSGATWNITGVQLEQNTQPTPFEQRPYAVELALCQRYYQRLVDPAGSGVNNASVQATRMTFPLKVQMRASPTSTMSGTMHFWNGNVTGTGTGFIGTFNNKDNGQLDFNGGAGVAYGPVTLYTDGGSQYIDFNAEL